MKGENKTLLVFILIVCGLLAFFAYLIHRDFTTLQVDEAQITSVNIDKFRKATWVYSYKKHYVFAGLHYEIKPGYTYHFEYYRGIPWSHLKVVEVIS